MSTIDVTGNLIDGEIITAEAALDVRDPADLTRLVGAVPAMSAGDIERVFAAAVRGAQEWAATGPLARGEVLLAAAAEMRRRKVELVETIVSEMGKTLAEAGVEVDKSAEFFEYYGTQGRQPTGEMLADGRPHTFIMVRREPLGVVLLITPWNDPLLTPARKLAPALSAGNAVVIKPASETPLITLKLAAILNDVGLPAGVLGTVTGRGSVIGDALLIQPLAAVSFTGSTEIGLGVHRALAGRQVRVQTEMGGKNAAVVLADADLQVATDCVMAATFAQAGQRCTATSRLIVVGNVADELLGRLSERIAGLVVGPGSDPSTTVCPLVSASRRDEVRGFVSRAIAKGATVIAGNQPVPAGLESGAFVMPVALLVTKDQEIWTQEVFGPVLSVLVVRDEAEAISAANDTTYGLSSSVYTRDLGAAHRFIDSSRPGKCPSTSQRAGGMCTTRSAVSETPGRRSRSRAVKL